jgi:hypothetical protein
MLALVNGLNLDHLPRGYHLMFQIPARAAGELGNNDIAITKEINIEPYVVNWLRVLATARGI